MGYYTRHYSKEGSESTYFDMFFEKGKKILDIGCATGNFMMQDKENITGLEYDNESIAIAKSKGLNVIQLNVDEGKLPFDDNSFDYINARSILEHIKEPLHLLKESKRILKLGGKLILITEDARIAKWKFWDGFEHKRPYTAISLMKGAIDAGFEKYEIFHLPHGFPFLGILHNKGILTGKTVLKIQKVIGKVIKRQLVMVAER